MQHRQALHANHIDPLCELKLLIVDDEPVNIEILKEILEDEGYENIESTTDPRNALALFKAYRPDLLLLDLRMPHLDGFQVMEQLSEIADDKNLTILILTAAGSKQNKIRALKAGAKDFVSKPFDAAEVKLRIHNVLETKNLQNKLQEQNIKLGSIANERMTEINNKHKQLNNLHERLEQIVDERTIDLHHTNKNLDRINVAISEMVSVVSHEMRNPLTSIKLFVEILRGNEGGLDEAQKQKFFNFMNREINRLQRLISNSLDVDKIQNGKLTWKAEKVDLIEAINNSVDLFTPTYMDKGLNISFEASLDTACTFIDKDKYQQVLTNLLSNALKFTASGGASIELTKTGHWVNIALLTVDSKVSSTLKHNCEEINSQINIFSSFDQFMEYLGQDGGKTDLAFVDTSLTKDNAVDYLHTIRQQLPHLPLATIVENTNFQTPHNEYGVINKQDISNKSVGFIKTVISKMIGISPTMSMLKICVSDTGIGIDVPEFNKIFSEYHQPKVTTSMHKNGTGLGLSISREIAEHYKGKIWVESKLGSGSKFTLLLPELKNQDIGQTDILLDDEIKDKNN